MFLNSNLFIPVKNTLGWNSVVYCACELYLLLSVVFYLVTAVQKFRSWLIVNT